MALIESGKSFDKEGNYSKLKTRMDNMDCKQYPLRIPTHMYKQVKIKLANEGKNLREVLLEMVVKYINE